MPPLELLAKEFFPAVAGSGDVFFVRGFSRRRFFLGLPAGAAAAAITLSLYPAQKPVSRFGKLLLKLWLRVRLPVVLPRRVFAYSAENPFARFLRGQGAELPGPSPFGVFCGDLNSNPRFIFLTFDADQHPRAVVKAGVGAEASRLIRQEAAVLHAAANMDHVPRVQGVLDSGRLAAVATPYFAGHSPPMNDGAALAKVMVSWIRPEGTTVLADFPAWRRLQCAGRLQSLYDDLNGRVATHQLRPVLSHGDFAPWNVKVLPGRNWQPIDWERGETSGIPCWDWFHFVVQSEILVRRSEVSKVCARIERLFGEPHFRDYASRTGARGVERELFVAHLMHAILAHPMSEGLSQTRALLLYASRQFGFDVRELGLAGNHAPVLVR